MDTKEIKLEIIRAGERAVRQLIKVAKEEIETARHQNQFFI